MEKLTAIMLTCIIIFSTATCMSIIPLPGTVEAEEVTEIPESPENPEEKEEEYKPHGSVSVAGYASIDIAPDRLIIILRLKYLHLNSADEASDEVAIMLDNLIKVLEELGLTKDDLESSSYRITAVYEWERVHSENSSRDIKVFKGYEAINTVKVTVKDFDKGGKVIDAAAEVGALVDKINFELSREKREELKLQAMAMAAEDAKLKAVTIISALGEELGNVKSVNLHNYRYKPSSYWDRELDVDFKGNVENVAPPTTILPGDLTISLDINVVFDIL